jgi:hypothetical protein
MADRVRGAAHALGSKSRGDFIGSVAQRLKYAIDHTLLADSPLVVKRVIQTTETHPWSGRIENHYRHARPAKMFTTLTLRFCSRKWRARATRENVFAACGFTTLSAKSQAAREFVNVSSAGFELEG